MYTLALSLSVHNTQCRAFVRRHLPDQLHYIPVAGKLLIGGNDGHLLRECRCQNQPVEGGPVVGEEGDLVVR